MKSITITDTQWKIILSDITALHKPSVYLIRDKMRSVLGFTVRDEYRFTNSSSYCYITLDFFSENKRTMFLLKYAEHIND